jgi:hypothetical protein
MKPRQLLLAAGLAVAGWFALFGDKAPAGDIAEPAARRQALAAPRRAAAPGTAATPDIQTLRPREELIGGARAAEGDALFASQSWVPPPPPPAPAPSRPEPEAQPAPTAPPLPFTYLGKKSEDGVWEVYLARGGETYIVREQSVIDRMYRVESIKPPNLSVTYMPLNQIQMLPIGAAQ